MCVSNENIKPVPLCSQRKLRENFFVFKTEGRVLRVNKIIKSLNPKKATGNDGISLKFLTAAADKLDVHITNILNNNIS